MRVHPTSPVARGSDAARPSWVLAAAIIGSAMTFIDGTAVNVVLPLMQRDLHASGPTIQWVVAGYSLFLAALILLGGALGDRFGRRRWFLFGIVLFAATSAVGAVAPTVQTLIVARCAAGVGAACAVPESLALLSATYQGAARGAGGPVLGGWLAQHVSWRAVFLINIPLAVVVIAIGRYRVPESRDTSLSGRLDAIGAVLATCGLGALTAGLIGAQGGKVTPGVVVLLVTGVALLAVFVAYEARVNEPMVPLVLFRERAFTVANLYTFALYGALGGCLYYVPFELIGVAHYAPTAAGAALLPFVVLQFLFSRSSGQLVARTGARIPLVAGALCAGLAFVLFAAADPAAVYWRSYFPAALVLGIGGVLFVSPLTSTIFDAVAVEHSGTASGINNAVSRCAGLLAIAAFGIVYASIAPGGTANPSAALRHDAFRAVMWLSSVVCVVAAAGAFAMPARLRA
jgi:EmrB/QacA subfamily drug resistance transporter